MEKFVPPSRYRPTPSGLYRILVTYLKNNKQKNRIVAGNILNDLIIELRCNIQLDETWKPFNNKGFIWFRKEEFCEDVLFV